MRAQIILLIVFLLIPIACRDDNIEMLQPQRPHQHPSTIQLTAEDVGVTDVMLKISIAKDNYPRTFTLKRDTTVILTKTLTSLDTVVIDKGRLWGLLPKHKYRYTLIRPLDNIRETRSRREEIKSIFVTTMDTTSHNFKWDIYTLGEWGSSLSDVAIINDTCVWVVGEINKKDSTGQIIKYNAARWDGKKWNKEKIPGITSYGRVGYYPLNTIFAYSSRDICVFSNVGSYSHWDGNQWSMEFVKERWGGVG